MTWGSTPTFLNANSLLAGIRPLACSHPPTLRVRAVVSIQLIIVKANSRLAGIRPLAFSHPPTLRVRAVVSTQ